jgi:hypothetical protein
MEAPTVNLSGLNSLIEDKLISKRFILTILVIYGYMQGHIDQTILAMVVGYYFASHSMESGKQNGG